MLELRGLTPRRYAQRLAPKLAAVAAVAAAEPLQWAAESLALRGAVYDLRASSGVARLDDAYVAAAQRVSEERLVQAAARLAATLNDLFCAGGR